MLKDFWRKIFKTDWIFGLSLILLFGIIRFYFVLRANVTGNYAPVSIIFLLMWAAPFVFLTKTGRKEAGLKRPVEYFGLLFCFISGAIVCTVSYLLANWMYGDSIANWYHYISRSYSIKDFSLSGNDRNIYFLIYAIVAMTISPVGEEFLYRGMIHQSFVKDSGNNRASMIDSLAFSITHLAHFGFVYESGTWKFLVFPALIWMLVMFVASRIFFTCRQRTGSITGAILSHAGFNLAMMYFIFYHVL